MLLCLLMLFFPLVDSHLLLGDLTLLDYQTIHLKILLLLRLIYILNLTRLQISIVSLFGRLSRLLFRGQVISYVSHLRKTETSRLSTIADDLYKLDALYASSPSPTLYSERVQLHAEYDLLMTNITARHLRQCRQSFFEHGDKAGKLLAHQARTASASRWISN